MHENHLSGTASHLDGAARRRSSPCGLVKPLAIMLAMFPLAAQSQSGEPTQSQAPDLAVVTVTAPGIKDSTDTQLGALTLSKSRLTDLRSGVTDSSQLLRDVPGISISSAGAISGLPAIHGLADDRVRIQVDGMDLMAACPNHMNSALSYINPGKVASIRVYPGIAPVSVGGDSIGGVIQVKSAPPLFAASDEESGASGALGTQYQSNGHGFGYNASAEWIGRQINIGYSESNSHSGNYKAGGDFKAATRGRENGPTIPGNVVGSSAYSGAHNRELGIAFRQDQHLMQMTVSEQRVGFEGFPNQRMDMTDNKNTLINLRYLGQFEWGDLEARFSDQDVRHKMDMGKDRYAYGSGMPMDTKAHTRNASLQAAIPISDRDLLRIGGEYQSYILYDWWPAVGGVMGPNDFWNIDFGRRYRRDIYGEWEARMDPAWTSLVGLRSTRVMTDAAAVQGYDNSLPAAWGNDAAAFNAQDRKRVDNNWDFTALLKFTPDSGRSFEGGYARKSRAPSLYQRYPWSTNPMAALMNNFVGDGNGYVGNPDLRPEVAHTLSVTGDWHDPEKTLWNMKATAYYSHVEDFIDARRCDFGQCSTDNTTRTTGFVHLQYVNERARIYGLDLSADVLLGRSEGLGSLSASGLLNYVHGENTATGDRLYNMMPLNAKLALVNRLAAWTHSAELLLSKGKTDVSQVRNEIPTAGYGVLNLRSSHQWKTARLDLGIDNLFNKLYALPLGGAYVGQGPSMTTNGIPWGTVVPGRGRSFNLALNLNF